MKKMKTYSPKTFIVLFEWMESMAPGLVNIFFRRTDGNKMQTNKHWMIGNSLFQNTDKRGTSVL